MTNTISAVARRRGSLATNRTTTRLGGPAVAANMAINMPKFLKENFGRHASPTNICGRRDQVFIRNLVPKNKKEKQPRPKKTDTHQPF